MFLASHALAETDEECAAVGRIAETVMQRRQDGLSLQSTLEVVSQPNLRDSRESLRQLAIKAYERPLAYEEDGKKRAVGEFRDAYQLLCMKQGK
jgi:hypothetical protein